eukprot:2790109-Pleurochrysis_carterae.AAC.1
MWPQEFASNSSSPNEISGPLPYTPFGEPRIRTRVVVWPGLRVKVLIFIIARRGATQPMSD